MRSMWPWILLERESYCRWSMMTISRKFHNNPVLVPPRKSPDPVKDFSTVMIMTWKQEWIYGLGWMCFQWSMENLIRHFNLGCGSFSLLLVFISSGIMWCVILLLCLCGLVFGQNWVLIEYLQTQSDRRVEVLDLYGKHSCWYWCYGPRMTSKYLTGSKSMIPQIWSWQHTWWILNVNHVGYLKIFIPPRR